MRDYASSQHAVPCEPCGGPDAGYVRPDITGEFPNNDAEYDKYYAGAFWTGTPFEGGYNDQLPAGGKTGRFKASWANSIYGRTSSDVAVSAVYTLIIIKA